MAKDPWRDEQRLIQGLRAQDPLSLEALIQQHARELFYVARLILAEVGSEQDVEECLNDLFLIAWKEVETFDPARGSLRSWLRSHQVYRPQLPAIPAPASVPHRINHGAV